MTSSYFYARVSVVQLCTSQAFLEFDNPRALLWLSREGTGTRQFASIGTRSAKGCKYHIITESSTSTLSLFWSHWLKRIDIVAMCSVPEHLVLWKKQESLEQRNTATSHFVRIHPGPLIKSLTIPHHFSIVAHFCFFPSERSPKRCGSSWARGKTQHARN